MTIKPSWTEHLHRFRSRQFDRIFGACPAHAFPRGLEIGAGDGYQSRLLATRVSALTCTELNERRLQPTPVEGITYRICDAERIDDYFPPQTFDLVFSSNLLEHLPDVHSCLLRVKSCLRDDGISIHCMPNVVWKSCNILLAYPNKMVELIERVTAVGHQTQVAHEVHHSNLKTHAPARRFRILPSVHGVSRSHFEEFINFSKHRWIRVFEMCDYEVAGVATSPFSSGYGFGFEWIRSLIERVGVGSEYIYIVYKKGSCPPRLRHFRHLL